MLTAVLLAVLTTTPPLVPAPDVIPPEQRAPLPPPPVPPSSSPAPPAYAPLAPVKKKPGPAPLKDSRFGLFFAPLNLFALALWVEGDLHLTSGLSVFANVGGGFLGQFGWDAGLRYSISGLHLDGFYVDFRNSGFALPEHEVWMTGPGVQLGYVWRTPAMAIAVGLGFTTWFSVDRGKTSAAFLGTPIIDADALIFPGVSQPFGDRPAVAPTLRVSIGPWF